MTGNKKRSDLAFRVFIAMAAGIAVGLVCSAAGRADLTEAYLRPFGTIFVNLLKFIVVPIVLLSIIDGMVSMGDIKKVGRVGAKTVVFYLITTAIACVIGLVCANLFLSMDLFPVLSATAEEFKGATTANFMDTLLGFFPSNMWDSFIKANMIQVIVIAIMIGLAILKAGERGKLCRDVLGSFYAVMSELTMGIIALSPIGVFAIMSWVVATQGPNIIGSLTIVILCAYIGYVLHAVIVYSAAAAVIAHMNPIRFFKSAFPAMAFAFSSASSVATLPVSKHCADEMGADPEISSFSLPLGATINMDGTAIYQCVATVFLATCCGMTLTLPQMVTVVLTATLASIGTAGTPGAGMVMLAMVLTAIGVDVNMIMLIFGVDRIFDMGRTTMNITGDISCALCISALEGKISKR